PVRFGGSLRARSCAPRGSSRRRWVKDGGGEAAAVYPRGHQEKGGITHGSAKNRSVHVFRELREGVTADGIKVAKPSTTLSTAEAIGVALDAAIHSRHFGSGSVGPADIGRNLIGSIVKEDLGDVKVLREYLNLVAKKRAASDGTWKAFHEAAAAALKT